MWDDFSSRKSTYGFRGDRVANNGREIGEESLRLFVEFLANGARSVLLLIRGVPNRYHVVSIHLGAEKNTIKPDDNPLSCEWD